jgi:hypothetical protein
MSKYKSKVDPRPVGDTNGPKEFIKNLKSGSFLWLDHTTSPPSFYISRGVVGYYISDQQAKTLMDKEKVSP